jgi:hypothetical protein
MSFLNELDQVREGLSKSALLGYIRRELISAEADLQEVESQMALFARTEGFSMGIIYIDEPKTWPAVFESLMQSASGDEVAAVVLPSLLHFAVLVPTHDVKDTFERATSTRVLLLNSPSSDRADGDPSSALHAV